MHQVWQPDAQPARKGMFGVRAETHLQGMLEPRLGNVQPVQEKARLHHQGHPTRAGTCCCYYKSITNE